MSESETAGSRGSWEFQAEGPAPERISESKGYTPSVEEVRERYSAARFYLDDEDFFMTGEKEFDRMLASERARIWDECDVAILGHVEREGTSAEGWPSNPYRKDGA